MSVAWANNLTGLCGQHRDEKVLTLATVCVIEGLPVWSSERD
jgi:hypothetical protein